MPLFYVWAKMFARPSGGQWRYSDTPINWYHIMTASDNSMDVLTSAHAWNKIQDPLRFCVSVKRLNYPLDDARDSGKYFGLCFCALFDN